MQQTVWAGANVSPVIFLQAKMFNYAYGDIDFCFLFSNYYNFLVFESIITSCDNVGLGSRSKQTCKQ